MSHDQLFAAGIPNIEAQYSQNTDKTILNLSAIPQSINKIAIISHPAKKSEDFNKARKSGKQTISSSKNYLYFEKRYQSNNV